jgi:predicted N-acetyltransferase YhbS
MEPTPRALRPDEWDSLNRLVSTVFRPTMFEHYPQLFNEANRENLRVIVVDGAVVSHVGMTQRWASLAGCTVRVACIGAVATYEAYRGRGYATAAFADARRKARADGVDIMLVSGSRGLYLRAGCRRVGRDIEYTITHEHHQALTTLAPTPTLELSPAGPEHIAILHALHATEPVRFIRPLEDWEMAFQCRIVMNRPADFFLVTHAAQDQAGAVAYLIVQRPEPERSPAGQPPGPLTARVVEFAGDRRAIAAALPLVHRHYQVPQVRLHVMGSDMVLQAHLAAAGLTGVPAPSSGTLLVINFPQLMERVRPLLAERLGQHVVGELEFIEEPGGRYMIRRHGEALALPDAGHLGNFLFGTVDPRAECVPEGSPALLTLLQRALPLPALWYGVNYV